jgi:hypothetical protein
MAFQEASNFKQYVYVGTSGELGAATTANFTLQRLTSSNLTPSATTTQSAEIDPARKAPADIRTNATGSGDIGIEFSAQTYDEMVRGVLSQDVWADQSAGGRYGASATGYTLNATTGVLEDLEIAADTFLSTNVGETLTLAGFTPSTADGSYVVAEVISPDSVRLAAGQLDGTTTLIGFATDTVGTVTREAYVTIGTDKQPIWIERAFSSGAGDVEYHEYYGYHATSTVDALIATWNLSFTPGAISTGSFGISAGFPVITGVTKSRPGTDQPVTTTTVINGMDDVTQVVICPTADTKAVGDGREFAARCTEFSFTFDNNAREDAAVGAFGTINAGLGTPSLSGTLNVYLEDEAVVNYLVSNDQLMIACQFEDAAGNKYALAFFEATVTNAETPVTGNNAAVLANLSWSARSFTVSRI